MTDALPPPLPQHAAGARPLPPPPPAPPRSVPPPPPPAAPMLPSTLPVAAAVGAIVVLTASLIASKYLLDAVVDYRWPVAVYVVMLGLVGYGPSLWWCRYASRRWGTGRLRDDVGLTPRWADLGWGPVVWLCALLAQSAIGAVILGFDIPIQNNTDGLSGIGEDRTYVISLVLTAVVVAPIVEEIVFRGVVMRGLRRRLTIVPVVILQGLLFGAAHIDPVRGSGNIGLVLVLTTVGIVLGAATALIGRLGPAMVAHAIFNGAVLAVVLTDVVDRL